MWCWSREVWIEMTITPLDILAIAAHRDDVEQTCGGTLLKMAQRGHRTGILDLTKGEMGTRGTAEDRAREAAEAAKILRVSWRNSLNIPDGRVENTWENRLEAARVIREQRPRVVILPFWKGRHPDHYTASILGYEACFLAGLAKVDVGKALSGQHSALSREGAASTAGALLPHRPFKIVYATLYYDLRPTFVVPVSARKTIRGNHGDKNQFPLRAPGSPFAYFFTATATPSRMGKKVVNKSCEL